MQWMPASWCAEGRAADSSGVSAVETDARDSERQVLCVPSQPQRGGLGSLGLCARRRTFMSALSAGVPLGGQLLRV